jgi:hypothetical protein
MASIEQAHRQANKLRRRSKQLLAFAALTLAIGQQAVQAQTFGEWFNQKSTQRQYLLQQITALWTYKSYAQKGYNIARGGLGSIGSYVGQEFKLHSGYYDDLNNVNALVSNDPQVKAILRWQKDILTKTTEVKRTDGLSREEKAHVEKVCAALLNDCAGQLHDLETVLENGKVEMSDEQRLRQIGRLYDNMQDNYRFAANFSTQLRLYALQKRQGTKDVDQIKALYGSDH